jgi:glycosyltransferase involved in cell wall biosynthesis
MKIAVVTAYHQITPELEQCLSSVRGQSYQDVIHIIIGDGCTLPSELTESVLNIPLPVNIGDIGDTPRALGVIYAKSLGVDSITFLDSDNWIEPNHIDTLVKTLQANDSHVVACKRNICHLDGSVMGVCPDSNGINFCDTNCLMVTKELFDFASSGWKVPDHLHVIGDRIIWDQLIHATDKISISEYPTVNYRTGFAGHYPMFGRSIPEGVKSGSAILEQKAIIDHLVSRSIKRMGEVL